MTEITRTYLNRYIAMLLEFHTHQADMGQNACVILHGKCEEAAASTASMLATPLGNHDSVSIRIKLITIHFFDAGYGDARN